MERAGAQIHDVRWIAEDINEPACRENRHELDECSFVAADPNTRDQRAKSREQSERWKSEKKYQP